MFYGRKFLDSAIRYARDDDNNNDNDDEMRTMMIDFFYVHILRYFNHIIIYTLIMCTC